MNFRETSKDLKFLPAKVSTNNHNTSQIGWNQYKYFINFTFSDDQYEVKHVSGKLMVITKFARNKELYLFSCPLPPSNLNSLEFARGVLSQKYQIPLRKDFSNFKKSIFPIFNH